MSPILVHCHLRWDGVWQRPQQIMSRMARNRRIGFVEEPMFLERGEKPFLQTWEADGVLIARPHVPAQREWLPEVSESNKQIIRELVEPFVREHGFRNGVRWHYAPMAIYLRDLQEPGTVVYDCMDELSAFKGAPPALVDCERELMGQADLMFTGGLSMFQNKSQHHANCHRFDSGVDVDHFARATDPATEIPEDARDRPHPIIGYYGVIDERMDYDTVRALSAAFPQGTIMLVGPVTKVDPRELPQAPNIVYTGQRGYADLPRYLKAFDVALVPFADNPATKFLSPTKTLEYFAGRKPVVSSPINDIVENYADTVRIARSPEEYVVAVREALAGPDPERVERGLAYARQKTWDAIVRDMSDLLAEAEARNSARRAA